MYLYCYYLHCFKSRAMRGLKTENRIKVLPLLITINCLIFFYPVRTQSKQLWGQVLVSALRLCESFSLHKRAHTQKEHTHKRSTHTKEAHTLAHTSLTFITAWKKKKSKKVTHSSSGHIDCWMGTFY